MLFFENDYGYGAHPKVLEYLAQTNMEPVSGYGNDKFTASAAEKIKAAADCPDAQVYFLTGGTQTNMVVIDTLLRPYEGVVASSCGHVNTHEAGAIESTGHKVCREFSMPLFLDGARLGYGLTADTDVTLQDIAKLTDVFYIGGTKCGALCGEAVVFTHGNMPKQFVTMVKRRGAMIAKGRLNALQFDALFTDGLYEKICAPAVKLAIKLRDGLKAKGYRFALESPTNQQFIIVENSRLPELQSKVVYSFIEKYDAEHTVIRLATSWATTEEQVDELLSIL